MYLKDLQIGNVKLENNILLAPMAGITDLAFRKVCKDFGASLVCTEMISSKAILYDDSKTNFGGNPPYSPGNSTGYFGLITVRKAIEVSSNIVNIKILSNVGTSRGVEFLNEIGMTQFNEKDEILSLALGGSENGTTPLQMAAGYAMIANGGEYIEPTFYTKVEDSNGNVILETKQETKRVMSEGNAYILSSILTTPVTGVDGTAGSCAISGMDVAAKTGTTTAYKDRWLCGFTPYYAAATWFGYDRNEEVRGFSQNPAGQIWDAIMTDVHSGLASATFEKPSGIVEQTVCRTTGCLATTGCNNKYTEIFTQDNLPEQCEGHGSQTICTESNKIATEYCSQYCEVRQNYYGAVLPKEELDLWTPVNGKGSTGTRINETCTLHTKPKEEEKPVNNTPNTNTSNSTNEIPPAENSTNTDNTTNTNPPSDTTNATDNTTNTN